ncbi:endonuclease/exonuclease/phosphatase family protein [Aquimarina brevivitae]|uniref:Endonuclease/exonuclease/phosphatase family metal-dependent hydrolase n=1 Tax=Aquimarina brevivitae TaxID=323412 RepID=A0A4Q7P1L9_9FLAO|nr:endonuclease/exonuclease/phosphatase family protein [Aquimarina brevivitae]RZS93270.1 endonuclease/exonuclease/phosphatase family metal-dependent hydrolase [Aquimarina brevivitae]
MRKLLNKLVFVANSVVAFALLLSYLLPYVSPVSFSLLSVLSLAVPLLLLVNIFFLVYWAVQLNKRLLLSLLVLMLGLSHVLSLYKISNTTKVAAAEGVSLMSYNVHSFNRFNWIASDSIPHQISTLIKQEQPDIFCVQEYFDTPHIDFAQYPYTYKDFNNDNGELALVIFSKFPIVNKGSLQFKKTPNNIIFADIKVNNDTLRVYNVHLQSHKINPDKEALAKEDSKKLLQRIQSSFKKQQNQAELLSTHLKSSPYKNVVIGDFNNSAFSYVYNLVRSERLKDAFKEAGSGFGKTFEFDFFPLRIDFILVAEELEVVEFKTFDAKLSDHYPILSRIKF